MDRKEADEMDGIIMAPMILCGYCMSVLSACGNGYICPTCHHAHASCGG